MMAQDDRSDAPPLVHANPWAALRHFTAARIGLGRAGVSQPTQPQLAFQLAHAQARDAVHLALDLDALQQALASLKLGCLRLHSAATDRDTYLQRPDLGRRLVAASRAQLTERRDAGGSRATAGADAPPRGPTTSPLSWPMACLRSPSAATPCPFCSAWCPACATQAGASPRSPWSNKAAWPWPTRWASCSAPAWW